MKGRREEKRRERRRREKRRGRRRGKGRREEEENTSFFKRAKLKNFPGAAPPDPLRTNPPKPLPSSG